MASVLVSSAVDRGYDYNIGICCFSTKQAALRRKSKDWLAQNQDIVSEWSDMSNYGLLFLVSYHYKNPTKCVGLVQSGPHHLSLKLTCFRHNITEKLLSWH